MAKTAIQIGDTAKDIITGFKGVVMAHIQFLTGCDQMGLCPITKKGANEKKEEWQYFDITRLERMNVKRVVIPTQEVVVDGKKKEKPGADGSPGSAGQGRRG